MNRFSFALADINLYRHRLIIFFLTLGMLVIFADRCLWAAQRAHKAVLQETLRVENLRVRETDLYGRAHPEPEKHLRGLQRHLALVGLLIPSQPEVGQFSAHLEQAARISGVRLISLKPEAMASKQGFQATSLELIIRGDYFPTLTFLRKLEETPRRSTVNGLSMKTQSSTLETRLKLIIYSDSR